MSGLNVVILQGNLGRAPEMRYTPEGTPVTKFSIAVQRMAREGRAPEADWFTVIVWGKSGEACNQYLVKGQTVTVHGRLQARSWAGSDGQKHYTTEVVARQVLFGRRPGEGRGGETAPAGIGDIDDDMPF